MVTWMSRVATNKGKSLLPSTLITLVIVAMLLISGPAQAVAVVISGQESYTKGNDIDFQVRIDLNENDKYVPLTNISLDLTGNVSKKAVFDLNGKKISGNCDIEMEPVSIPNADDSGYGYGYDSGYGYKFGYGYGYGYGYGGGGEKISFIYNVTIDSKCLPLGNYSVVATLNTGKNVVFQSPIFKFSLLPSTPGQKIKAKIDIKPETINLASKGKFTAFISLPEGFDVRDIDVGTVEIEGAHAVKSMISKENGGTLIAKFNTQDLEDVHTGNAVKFTVTGMVDGTEFEGSDTVKVIDQGKVEECECDDDSTDDDNYDECDDDKLKEHDQDDKKIKEKDLKTAKDQKPKKNKDDDKKNRNNGGQARNTVENNNNIYIINNTGVVNVYIDNQGSGNDVNQGGNNNANGNKKGNQGNNNQRSNNGNGNNGKGNNGKSKK